MASRLAEALLRRESFGIIFPRQGEKATTQASPERVTPSVLREITAKVYSSDDLEVWNLTPGGIAYTGAQSVFNVVGRLKRPGEVKGLTYALNGGARRAVFLGHSVRTPGPGDFNIDTIALAELAAENRLDLWLDNGKGGSQHSISFATRQQPAGEPRFRLSFDGVRQPEELGQFIDGRWCLGRDETGRPCLEIRAEDAGYDRLIGFGRHDWTLGYRVEALFTVVKWTRRNYFNVGLIFKWNPHRQGGGTALPTHWNTGLAYYAAKCPGLRLRFGVNMRSEDPSLTRGDHVLQEKTISPWWRWAGFVRNQLVRVGSRPITQLKTGVAYRLNLRIDRDLFTLEIREEGRAQPLAALSVSDPPDHLPEGCVGIIACNSAVRFYEYDVSPT